MSDERTPDGKFTPDLKVGLATRWPKGKSQNPGGVSPLKRELRELMRACVPKAIERMAQILDDDEAGPKAWSIAAEFLAKYGVGTPRPTEKDDAAASRPRKALTDEQREALARLALSSERSRDDAGPDAEH